MVVQRRRAHLLAIGIGLVVGLGVPPPAVATYRFALEWGGAGSAPGKFNSAPGLATDPASNVYVADLLNNRIQKFSGAGAFLIAWGSLGVLPGQFSQPTGVAADSDGNVYVADTFNHRIEKFSSTGEFITAWGSPGSLPGQFLTPTNVGTGPDGSVYVADTFNNRVQKFGSDGEFIIAWGSAGSGDGEFDASRAVATDPTGGYVYVTDRNNHRIQKFTAAGGFVTKWGTRGSQTGQLAEPHGITTDAAGYVYVADKLNDRIQKFDANGRFITAWGRHGSGSGEFNEPRGVAIGQNGDVYVTDSLNHRIQKFRAVLPRTTIRFRHRRPTRDRTPALALSSSFPGSIFECQVLPSAARGWVACRSRYTTPRLRDGRHVIRARATDSDGLTDPTPARIALRVDTVPPRSRILEQRITGRVARFTFAANERGSTFECRVDRGRWRRCGSPFKALCEAGRQIFRVRALDRAGNRDASPAVRRFHIRGSDTLK